MNLLKTVGVRLKHLILDEKLDDKSAKSNNRFLKWRTVTIVHYL